MRGAVYGLMERALCALQVCLSVVAVVDVCLYVCVHTYVDTVNIDTIWTRIMRHGVCVLMYVHTNKMVVCVLIDVYRMLACMSAIIVFVLLCGYEHA